MDEKLQDRIDGYILGRMSFEDEKRFERELEENIELQEQYNYTRLLKETLCEYAELQELMGQWDKEIEEELLEEEQQVAACAAIPAYDDSTRDIPAKPNRNNMWFWISGIAAVLVVGLFVINPILSDSEYQYCSIAKDIARNGEDDLNLIDSLLINQKYSEALIEIEDEIQEMNSVINVDSNMKDTLDPDLLEQIEYERHRIKMRFDDLNWMKVYALLGLERKSEAISLLELLKSKEGYYQEKADSLYNSLK